MASDSVRLTTAQALVRYLCNQFTEIDGERARLFAGVFGIFGHGNVTCRRRRSTPSTACYRRTAGRTSRAWRWRRSASPRRCAAGSSWRATSSVGPGAMNMVTAAAVAHANRLPLLLLAGDTFHSRIPDPVLQQVEHFDQPSITTSTTPSGRSRATGIASPARRRSCSRCRSRSRRCSTRPTAARRSSASAGRAGRGLRLPGAPLRAGRARGPPPASRPARARRGRRRPAGRQGAADRGGRRRALLARRGGAAALRRAARRARRRDDGGQVVRCSPITRCTPGRSA